MKVLRDAHCPNLNDCPKVYEPIEDGRVPVRGDKLDIAQRAKLGPLPDHEDVVLVPTTVLSDVREVLTLDELGDFIDRHHTFDLFRLEVLPFYNSGSDDDDLHRYLRGDPAPTAKVKQASLERIRTDTGAGRIRRRVHAVAEPLTDYLRYEAEWGYVFNSSAGERIRIATLTEALTRVGDFFILDGEHVLRSRYDESCRFSHAEVLQPDATVPYVALAELLWDDAVDFAPWWAARPADHRDTEAA